MGKTINFKYKFSELYNPVYINGAYGGINPQGEIIMNFYLERSPIPKEEQYTIDELSVLTGPVTTDPEDHSQNIIRFVETGIVLNLENAKKINEWLGQHILQLEALKNQKGVN